MAAITLRAYLDDLEHLAHQEALEEVIGHCKYILSRFPKNIAVYRIYGRALTGKARYDEAQEIFERVLSALPDDFTAHVSMSEIAEQHGAEGSAPSIFHLERAFEQQPNNAALQTELRRLYEMRGGSVPDRIPLTRGALARTYYKSQLYDQAIAEVNFALRSDPDRPDLLTLLALAQWDSQRIVEAGETALRILAKLPYALDANRLLARLWLQNKRPSDALSFLSRLGELDPFAALELADPANPNVGERITMQRLDWNARSSAAMLDNNPDWVQDIGGVFGADQSYGGESVEESVGADPFGLQSGPAGDDWMFNFTAPADVPVPATDWYGADMTADPNLPDWFAESSAPPATDPADEIIPDWFTQLGIGQAPDTPKAPVFSAVDSGNRSGPFGDADPPKKRTGLTGRLGNRPPAEETTPPSQSIPSWLADAPDVPATPPVWADPASDFFAQEPPVMPQELPPSGADSDPSADWLSEFAEPANNVPDWLTPPPANVDGDAAQGDTALAAQSGDLDWLNAPAGDAAAPGAFDFGTGDVQDDALEFNFGDAQGAPDWLNPPMQAEGASMADSTVSDAGGDWLSALGSDGELPTFNAVKDTPPVVNSAADWDAEGVGNNDGSAEGDDWLNSLGNIADFPIVESAQPVAQDDAQDDTDWLAVLSDPPEDIRASNVPLAQTVDDAQPVAQDDWLAALGDLPEDIRATNVPLAQTADDANWLNSLEDIPDMASAAQPASVNDTLLGASASEWLADSDLQDAAPVSEESWLADLRDVPAGASGTLEVEDRPAWLADLAPAGQTATPEAALDPLDWMADLPVDAAPLVVAQPVDAQPLDWMKEPPAEPVIEDDWLAGFEPETTPATRQPTNWLDDLAAVPPRQPLTVQDAIIQSPEGEPEFATANRDDWMRDLGSGITPASEVPEEEAVTAIPSWLSDLKITEEETLPVAEPPRKRTGLTGMLSTNLPPPSQALKKDTGVLEPDILPDWLQSSPEPTPAAAIVEPTRTAEPAAELNAVEDWFSAIPEVEPGNVENWFADAAEPDAPAEVAAPVGAAEDDWLNAIKESDASLSDAFGSTPPALEPERSSEAPEWLTGVRRLEPLVQNERQTLEDYGQMDPAWPQEVEPTPAFAQSFATPHDPDNIDIDALMGAVHDEVLADPIVETPAPTGRYIFERLPAWLRRRTK